MVASPFDDVARRPGDGRWGRSVLHFAQTGSTNDDALEAALRGEPEGYLVTADAQERGRGRHGRTWDAAQGANILASWVVRPRSPVETWSLLPLAAAVAVADVAERFAPGAGVRVKWPNDVRIAGRKLAGILAEARIDATGKGFLVVGIGLNVNQVVFEPGLDRIATSLALVTGHAHDRPDVLAALCDALERHMVVAADHVHALLSDYRALLEGVGTEVTVSHPGADTHVEGLLEGVDARGALVLSTPGGRRTFSAGEVTLRHP